MIENRPLPGSWAVDGNFRGRQTPDYDSTSEGRRLCPFEPSRYGVRCNPFCPAISGMAQLLQAASNLILDKRTMDKRTLSQVMELD